MRSVGFGAHVHCLLHTARSRFFMQGTYPLLLHFSVGSPGQMVGISGELEGVAIPGKSSRKLDAEWCSYGGRRIYPCQSR